jgi:transcriptional regulator with GAF, ATPase, and Fis domain/tetratricopeptide (TPR) repeat protein
VVAPEEAGRLSWEHELLTGIAHPNLAPVHELLTVAEGAPPPYRFGPGATILVEGFAPGARASRAVDAVPDEERTTWVLGVGIAIGRALAAIHRVGLVHGDIKPDNVVVGDDPLEAIVVDLGLARPPGSGSTAAGTPAFLAPEAWQGQRSRAVDLYALGATLHHLLGGKSPLTDTRSASVAELWARATASPRGASSLPTTVPASLGRLIDSLLSLEPTERPESARDVVSRLSSIRSESGGEALSKDALAELAASATEVERAMAITALPLAGRREELATLEKALASAGVVTVAGPSGAGRTRLVHEAVRKLQRARAEAWAKVPTFTSTVGALGEAPSHDAVLLVEDADAVSDDDARALVSAAELDGVSLSVVLERAERPEGATGITLGVADPSSMAALLRSALGKKPSNALSDAALEASGGLPGRLCRLLSATLLDGNDPTRPETLRASSTHAGPAVLPARGRTVAEHLAVAGGSLPPEVLTSLLGIDAAAGLSALAAEGAVSFGGAGVPRLRRDLVVAFHKALEGDAKRSLADALSPFPIPNEARAFVQGARSERDAANESLSLALSARRERGDAEGAIALARLSEAVFGDMSRPVGRALADALRARGRYAEALEVLDGDDEPAAVALRAELLRLSGRRDEATDAVERVASNADPSVRFAARATAARLTLDRGEPRAALSKATSAAAEATSKSDAVGEARLSEVAALSALYVGDATEAGELAERAIAAARRGRAPEIEARAHAVAATIALSRGEIRRAAERYGRAFELAEAAGELHGAAAYLLNLGVTRLDAGDLGQAQGALREGARRLARLGRDQDLSRALYNLGLAGVLAGDDDLAGVAVKAARGAAARAGDRSAAAFAAILEAELALRGGQLTKARDAAGAAAEGAERASARDRAVVFSRRAQILAALGDMDDAAASLERARVAADGDDTDLSRSEYAVAAARVALAASDAEAAVAAATDARGSAERFGSYEARLRASLSSADAADAAGDHEGARRHLSSARALLDAAANTLPPAARARMRAVAAYQRAFAAVPRGDGGHAADDRFRRLVFYARRLTAERRVSRLYEEILDAAIDLSGAERGFVVIREEDGTLRVRVARGLDRKTIAEDARLFSRSLAARAIDTGAPISTVDALHDERLDSAASVHALALRSVVAVPFKREGEVRGAIYLDDRLRPGAFGPNDIALLSDLADLSSIALDGAERLRRERRSRRRLEVRGRRLEHQVETQARQIESLRRSAGGSAAEDLGIIGRADSMKKVMSLVERVAPSSVPVLVTGESGTGKELVARAIHRLSERADGPFVIENVSAIPETLLESELFGHVRGAFTGADRARVGLFEAASGGTLFLDEIGEMSAAMQAKLLRAVQEGEVRPVGSSEPRKIDVRLIAATHRDLPALISRGDFREDLFYRLAVVTVELPPLRERRQDVPALVAHFITRHAQGRDVEIDDRTLACLSAFSWPGNVRQLENEVQRALVLSPDRIRPEHLSEAVRGDAADEAVDELDLKGQVRVLEKRLIGDALSRCGGNQTKAAKLLGVSRYGLQKMLKRLDIK